jgi:hypothetical protein
VGLGSAFHQRTRWRCQPPVLGARRRRCPGLRASRGPTPPGPRLQPGQACSQAYRGPGLLFGRAGAARLHRGRRRGVSPAHRRRPVNPCNPLSAQGQHRLPRWAQVRLGATCHGGRLPAGAARDRGLGTQPPIVLRGRRDAPTTRPARPTKEEKRTSRPHAPTTPPLLPYRPGVPMWSPLTTTPASVTALLLLLAPAALGQDAGGVPIGWPATCAAPGGPHQGCVDPPTAAGRLAPSSPARPPRVAGTPLRARLMPADHRCCAGRPDEYPLHRPRPPPPTPEPRLQMRALPAI